MSLINGRNLIAQDPAGAFVNVKADYDGTLSTDTQKSAFGETLTATLTPVIQETFQYTINSRVWNSTVVDTGTVSHDNAKAVLATGTTALASAELKSKKRIKYRAGCGVVCRFTALWDGASTYESLIGVGDNNTNGLYFYNTSGVLSIRHINNSVLIGSISQTAWDDPCDGSASMPVMDWTKGNVFEIRYQYLGYGAIRFYIENPTTGLFQLVHTIKYANTNTEPSLSNSTLPFVASIFNTGASTTNADLKIGSVGCFVEGVDTINETVKNTYTREVLATTTETAVFTIRNNTTFNAIDNNSIVYPTYLSVSNTETKTTTIWLTENTTLGGIPAYADVDSKTSLIAIDEAGTTLTLGDIILTLLVGPCSTERINLREYGIEIQPGNTLTISSSTNANTSNIIYTIGWIEDQ